MQMPVYSMQIQARAELASPGAAVSTKRLKNVA